MATELRSSFPVLEDLATGAGKPWHSAIETDAAAGRTAAPALVAKDGGGLLRYLKVNTNGELVTSDSDSDIVCLSAEGTIDDGSATLALVCEITLQNSKIYKDLETVVSCYRDAKYEVEWVDDEGGGGEAITTLMKGRVGSGDYTDCCRLQCKEFTSGATGVQKLRIRALNQNSLSDIDGSIAIKEIQTL